MLLWRHSIVSLFAGLALTASGCGGTDGLATVTGRVTLDGQPLESAFITFTPTGAVGTPTFGKTDSDGNYEMQFSDTEAGGFVGENKVTITTADIAPPGMPPTPERVPLIYNKNSDLVRTVEPGHNEFNFDLESDAGEIVQPRFE